MILAEGRRADLTLISPWYPSNNPMRVWSASVTPDDEYPTEKSVGSSGLTDARVAARKEPVYVLEGSTGLCAFRNAGFSVLIVEPDILYELVPPGGTPYTGSETQQWAGPQPDDAGLAADEPATCISRINPT